jgi:hypothetical protein
MARVASLPPAFSSCIISVCVIATFSRTPPANAEPMIPATCPSAVNIGPPAVSELVAGSVSIATTLAPRSAVTVLSFHAPADPWVFAA